MIQQDTFRLGDEITLHDATQAALEGEGVTVTAQSISWARLERGNDVIYATLVFSKGEKTQREEFSTKTQKSLPLHRQPILENYTITILELNHTNVRFRIDKKE